MLNTCIHECPSHTTVRTVSRREAEQCPASTLHDAAAVVEPPQRIDDQAHATDGGRNLPRGVCGSHGNVHTHVSTHERKPTRSQ